MWGDLGLSLKEFVMREPLPLSRIHEAVFDLLRGREDAVVFGAQAVNAYVAEPRMTQDIDILSPRAEALAEELRIALNERLGIAARVHAVAGERGHRIYQIQQEGNRHLVDIRQCDALPPARSMEGVLVPLPEELIAMKIMSHRRRQAQGHPKAGTDWRDLVMLLLAFPILKTLDGSVAQALTATGADDEDFAAWRTICAQTFHADDEADGF